MIDTELTDELRAEGDARELQRAIQDLRKDAGLALDDRIELWVDGLPRRSRPISPPSPRRRWPTPSVARSRRRPGAGGELEAARSSSARGRAARLGVTADPPAERATDGLRRGATTTPETDGQFGRRTRRVDAAASGRVARRWPLFVGLAAPWSSPTSSRRPGRRALSPGESVEVVGDLVRIVFGQNTGALFGLFKDNAAPMFGSSRSS